MTKVTRTSCSSISISKPGLLAAVFPSVRHFCPGSRTPNLPSIRPPCTAIPSSSYVSGCVISQTEYFLISCGDHTAKVIPSIDFVDVADIILSPLVLDVVQCLD